LMHGTVHISDHEQEIAKLFIQVVEQQKLFSAPFPAANPAPAFQAGKTA